MLTALQLALALLLQLKDVEPPRDYTGVLITITVAIGLFLMGQLVAALLWAGKITAQLDNVKGLMSDIPKKGDVSAEISKMQAELLKYVNERAAPQENAMLSALAELNRKVESIGRR